MNNPFASLKFANFRYYWIGMCISLIGTWMQNIAQPWLAYSLTESPLLLSLVGVFQFSPVIFLSLFAGAIIDRFPKKQVLLVTQSLFLLMTLTLTLMYYFGHLKYWHILGISLLMGIVNSFDMPARQSFVIHLVEKDYLMNAIALNSMSFNMARVIGPTIAGVVMGFAGVGICFLINTISYAAVIIGLFYVRPNEIVNIKNTHGLKAVNAEIVEGLKYIKKRVDIIAYLLAIAVVGTFAMNNAVLVPVFTKVVLGLDETYFGLIMSIFGLGSFAGAFLTAALSKGGPKQYAIFDFPYIIGFSIIGAGLAGHFALNGLALAITGFFFILFASVVNTSIQLDLDPKYRGRVMSVYTLVFAGVVPIGNFFAGVVTHNFGARIGFMACGAMIIVLMLILRIRGYKHIKN